ncbi:MAG: ATP-binding protein, partial [Candidatus Zixiibacteriota bacterium]
GTVTVKLRQDNGHVLLLVADTGSGVPEGIRNKVFSPYFSTKEKGTGLGLSIVHQIVEEFRGQIDLASSESGGAQFSIRFPI